MPVVSLPAPTGRLKPAPFVLCPGCPEAIGNTFRYVSTAGTASAVWPSADLAIGYPFVLNEPRTALQMWTSNGATTAATRDVGIYDAAGNRLVSIGSTAGSGTSAIQTYNIADTVLAASTTYYCWMSSSSGTDAFIRWVAATNIGQLAATGVVQMASAFALPSTITAAALTNNYLPAFGIVFTSDW